MFFMFSSDDLAKHTEAIDQTMTGLFLIFYQLTRFYKSNILYKKIQDETKQKVKNILRYVMSIFPLKDKTFCNQCDLQKK